VRACVRVCARVREHMRVRACVSNFTIFNSIATVRTHPKELVHHKGDMNYLRMMWSQTLTHTNVCT